MISLTSSFIEEIESPEQQLLDGTSVTTFILFFWLTLRGV